MSLGGALRGSITDFYFNSWRLAPANLAWAAVLILAFVAGPLSVVGMALLVLLALPTVGLYRMGALVARGEPTTFADFLGGMRRSGLAALAVALAAVLLAVVFTTNVVVGLEARNPLGWFISAMALWGDVGLAMFLVAFWPVLVDPQREALGFRQRLTLAGLAVIGRPVRMLALTAIVGLILVLSTILFAAIVLVSVAYVAVFSSRVVLPLVDALEARLPEGRRLG